ncbi:hypothetical protein HYPSUDRAFT_127889 [Hypholoma sublateritium FD-334 SS-4]|uniref:FMR1-interacting protein 1 conserved domain-containing protein n=1 Tax=Hypholoma sublateritium (strain FD-334 SS-4) TaxID=945553 RepID=A0A0D2PEF7_HYPSF|nr:hypothetical protein HYPSUDRAFT_127889 [Hypholoma sublateritium FD-334 SS-4]
MQRPHPSSLPNNPNAVYANQQIPYQQGTPYPTYYNSHYLQAYTLSQSLPQSPHLSSGPINSSANFIAQGNAGQTRNFAAASSSWYQHGNHRCTYNGCAFTGSTKSVELHMMDRHLIYPPGWDQRKKRSDWDADPSLKGKPVPIQGTNVVLDDPEVLEAWIAERKRRFPTSSRVDDKKRKMEEAVARGQLDLSEAGVRASKRRKTENTTPPNHQRKRKIADTQSHGTAANSAVNDRVPDSGWGARSKVKIPQPAATAPPVHSSPPSLAESDDDDQAPEIVSSKVAPLMKVEPTLPPPTAEEPDQVPKHARDRYQKKLQPLQPKMAMHNPFASRPKLLRNLLLPEIRVTVSNLSQAIRFLVDNDFLRDVELKPGQAAERSKIEVLEEDDQTLNSSV